MQKILIGSSALRHWFPDFKREPKDLDYFVDRIPEDWVPIPEIEFFDVPSCFRDYPGAILEPRDLLTLKASHLLWDINWRKHMFDVQFLVSKGFRIDPEKFLSLVDHWETVHGRNTRSDLKMTAKDFFDNAVRCEHDHDYLHTLIVPVPTYTKVLRDGSEVEPDGSKFERLSHEEKISLVREEVYVMAYERLAGRSHLEAYEWMLKKFIISHAPLWEAIFIIENYIELHRPHINYVKLINNELQRAH